MVIEDSVSTTGKVVVFTDVVVGSVSVISPSVDQYLVGVLSIVTEEIIKIGKINSIISISEDNLI